MRVQHINLLLYFYTVLLKWKQVSINHILAHNLISMCEYTSWDSVSDYGPEILLSIADSIFFSHYRRCRELPLSTAKKIYKTVYQKTMLILILVT